MAIAVGSVEVDVIPNTRGIYAQLRAGLVPAATRAGEDAGSAAGRAFGPAMQRQVGDIGLRIGEEIGQQIANRITASLRDAIRDGVTQGGRTARPAAVRQGDETAGAFSRALKTRLEAAFRSLPKLQIGADTSEVDADLQAVRVRMETLADKRVGIDISAEDAKAEIKLIEAELTRLGAKHPNVQVRADTAAALAQLAAVRAEIDAVDGKRTRIDIDTTGAVGAIFQLTAALAGVAAIPAIPVLAAGLGAVASAGVAAAVGVGAIAAVAIPAFTGIAGALLAQKQAQDAATNATLKGGQAAGQGASKAFQLAGAQQSLAAAHRNAARQIGQAQQGVQDAVRQAAEASRNAAQQVQQAEKGVADAVQQAAEQQQQAVQQVKEARQGLADAVQQAADRQQAANDRVVQAERSLADAQDASRQAQLDLTQARRDAAMELEDLSNRLADAQLSERGAALAVLKARQRLNAVRAAGDRASLLTQQEAQLAYDEAVQRLKEQQVATKRTAAEKKAADQAGVEGSDKVRTAQERVAQAQQAVRDQTADLARAQREAARQQQDNARDIAVAQGRVAEAQRNVARVQKQGSDAVAAAQDKLAEAQRNVVRVQEDGARSVARAQDSLVAAQQSAADSIASAQRQIESSSISAAGGVDQAALAQQKYQEKLAKLTPAARETFDAFVDLRGAFSKWSRALQPAVMPIFTRALKGLKNSLPGLTPIVKGAADGIKELQDRASAGFKKPWWQEFKKDLAENIGPAIVGLGVSVGNVFKGMVGIVDGFLVHTDGINKRMEGITGRFADWGTSLKGSPAFERFLSYASEKGPQVARTIGDISSAFYQIARALEPLSGPILEVIGGLARGIASIAENLPWLIQLMYLAWIATRLWTLALLVFNAVLDANPITLIILAIIGLVAAVVYAWKNFSWFRTVVTTVWSAIKTAALAAWAFLQPIFAAIWGALQWVGDKAVWLWQNILRPVFLAIALAAGILIAAILTILITPLVLAFKLVARVATWLWANAIKPAFNAISAAASWLWRNAISPAFHGIASVARWLYNNVIKPVAALIKGSFHAVGETGRWLWQKALAPAFRGIANVARWLNDKVIKPVFHAISTVIGTAWRTGIRPVFNAIKSAIGKVADAFKSAKDAIKEAWSAIKDATKKPINWVLKHVWNEGIVAVWKKITGWIPGVPQLGKVDLLASGGKLRGPQPGMYNQPTAIVGEGNPRYPEYVIPTDPRYRSRALGLHQAAGAQLLAKGGIIGDIWDGISSVGKGIGNFFKNPMKSIKGLLDPLLEKGKHLKNSTFGKMVLGLPRMAINGLKSLASSAINKLFGGGSERVATALHWAQSQAGKPYQWGGAGNPSWDCSGFMSGIQKVIQGKNPKGRIWSTFSFRGKTAPKGWVKDLTAPFMIGITNRGKGHTAGTLAGVNVESRGGDGVIVGKGARGARSSFFDAVYGFQPSINPIGTSATRQAAQATARQMLGEFGFSQKQWPALNRLWEHESGWRYNANNPISAAYGIPQANPGRKMASAGADWLTNPTTQIKWGLGYIKRAYGSPSHAWDVWQSRFPHWYDSGGYLQPGLNLAYNGTGRPEPVFTSQQANSLMRLAAEPGGTLSLDGQQLQLVLDDGSRFTAHLESVADGRIAANNQRLVSTLRANRRG